MNDQKEKNLKALDAEDQRLRAQGFVPLVDFVGGGHRYIHQGEARRLKRRGKVLNMAKPGAPAIYMDAAEVHYLKDHPEKWDEILKKFG
jgi:hypothetical protein